MLLALLLYGCNDCRRYCTDSSRGAYCKHQCRRQLCPSSSEESSVKSDLKIVTQEAITVPTPEALIVTSKMRQLFIELAPVFLGGTRAPPSTSKSTAISIMETGSGSASMVDWVVIFTDNTEFQNLRIEVCKVLNTTTIASGYAGVINKEGLLMEAYYKISFNLIKMVKSLLSSCKEKENKSIVKLRKNDRLKRWRK